MSTYGTRCVCGRELIAPERSEFVSECEVRHRWFCSGCGRAFETSVRLDAMPLSKAELIERFFPSLLVA